MNDPDEALAALSQKGDQAAFAELIRRHQRMVHSLTYRMTGSQSDADDLAQEAFVNAWRHLPSWRGESRFSTWLYRVALNACLGWRRQEARRADAAARWTEACADDLYANGHAPPPPGNGDPLQAALLRLPPKQRAAIMLTVHDGMNHAEAAEVMKCSEATISWRVFSARRKLRQWLANGSNE